MEKIRWKIYGKLAWHYCHKAGRLINNRDGMNSVIYRRRLHRYINKMMYWMDRRLKVCL